MAADLLKINALLQSQQEDNEELALLLLANQEIDFAEVGADTVLAFFEHLATCFDYFRAYEEQEASALEELALVAQIAAKHYPSLQVLGYGRHLAEFIGAHFFRFYPEEEEPLTNPEDWEQILLEFEALFNPLDLIYLLYYSKALALLRRTAMHWEEVRPQDWEATDFEFPRYCFEQFKRYYKLIQTQEDWDLILSPLLNSLKTYLLDCSTLAPHLFQFLGGLWYLLSTRFAHHISEQIYQLTLLDCFDKEEQIDLLLMHPLFYFTEWHLDRIGGMPPDDEFNLYDTLEEDVQEYANHFRPFLPLLKTIDGRRFRYYKYRIYEVWGYFYQEELLPYLNFIQQKDPKDPQVYFYLAQANAVLKNYREAIDLYMRYISLAPLEIPKNEFFLSEMRYASRTYPPSALEAITHIGYLYEYELDEEERALYYYEQSIKLRPNHHQAAYWELIKNMVKKEEFGPKLFHYVKTYVKIIFFDTVWLNPKDFVWNIIPEIDDYRRAATAWKEQLTVYDPDFDRKFGFEFLKHSLLSLLWELAEHFQTVQNYSLSFEATILAKQLYKVEHIRSSFPLEEKKIVLPYDIYTVSWEDILYLQARNIIHLQKDYWQARMLFQQILKSKSNHKGAKEGLDEIRRHLGY